MADPWKRREVIGDWVLYQGDNADVLPKVSVADLLLTDPPFGIKMATGFDGFGGFGGFGPPIARRQYEGQWDDERPDGPAFQALLGSAKHHIIWGGNYFTDLLPLGKRWLFWDKIQTMPTYSDGELAWTSLPGVSVKQFTYNGSGLHAKEKNRQHPTQKPVALMSWCINLCPKVETVIDPYMGVGSSLVACAKLGRKGIGIELDPDYFDIACARVEEAYRQPDFFVEPPAKPEQTGFDV